ncbi:MAG: 6-phosphofructokinase 1 [Chloroflexi bacterium]|nr:MAG: 6-phosphofructokinase 1 [Chloroflexota bacterium]
MTNNILVLQSGGCTPVLNRSLFGVAQEASLHASLGDVLGAVHGLEGVLADDLVDLGRVSAAAWKRVAGAPAAALGSTRRKLKSEDVTPVLEMLARHDIRFLFIIGGNDSAETGHAIGREAQAAGYALSVVNVPKTIDNDLMVTDHSPGYGSAARFIALATMGAGADADAMGAAAPITIIEVMGRDAGWLAAAAALGRREDRDPPHVICVPEVDVHEYRFLDLMEAAYRRFGAAVAVVAENAKGPNGVLGGQEEPWLVDDFGHAYYDGPARYLAGLLSKRLGVRVRHEKPGTIQRSFVEGLSRTDVREAEMAGRAAVRYALEGRSDCMVTLVRQPGEKYECTTDTAPFELVAGKVWRMPESYLDPANYQVTQAFTDYARPLIGAPLPHFGRLR